MLAIQKISLADEVGIVRPVIHTERCKGCGICTAFCPEKILFLGEQLNSYGYPTVKMGNERACRRCLRCRLMCPDVVFAFAAEENRTCRQ
jgi:2-oxoglutarate ferredoxin oxidoreductase subunit delta